MKDLEVLQLALMATALGAAGCDWLDSGKALEAESKSQTAAERTTRLRRACASQATYDRLKELAFDEAIRIRGGEGAVLESVATASVVRMEQPVVKSRDEELNVTVCTGRFVLELPPGVESAFNGERRLTANIEYAAQAALDGSGLVYRMNGAEPIIYRLATVGGVRTAQAAPPPVPDPSPTVSARPAAPPPASPPQPAPATPPAAPEARPTQAAARPSFDCRRAGSRSERMVCSNAALAARDRRMASQFYSALAGANSRTRRALRTSRDQFLAYRERCGSAACVAQAYQDRMDEIRDIAGGR